MTEDPYLINKKIYAGLPEIYRQMGKVLEQEGQMKIVPDTTTVPEYQ